MNIKELEFIRDFNDDLHLLIKDLTDIVLSVDEIEGDERPRDLVIHSLWSLVHQSDLLEKLFENFKERVDQKSHDVWKKAHPHMEDIKQDEE